MCVCVVGNFVCNSNGLFLFCRQVSSDNLLPPVSEVVTISERLAEEES